MKMFTVSEPERQVGTQSQMKRPRGHLSSSEGTLLETFLCTMRKVGRHPAQEGEVA